MQAVVKGSATLDFWYDSNQRPGVQILAFFLNISHIKNTK